MGTRNNISVVIDNDIMVHQYGQWDGYPSGQGQDIVNFLTTCDLDTFKAKVRKLKQYTPKAVEKIECSYSSKGTFNSISDDEWQKLIEDHPELTRDSGSRILGHIQSGKVKKVVFTDFTDTGCFGIEWSYLIDLDHNSLWVFKNGTMVDGELVKEIPFKNLKRSMKALIKKYC